MGRLAKQLGLNKIQVSSYLLDIMRRTLTIPSRRTSRDWAKQNRILPPGLAEPGKFRPERTPYFNHPSKAISYNKYKKYVIVTATQSGKTEFCFNLSAQRLDDDPCPQIFVYPTENAVKAMSNRYSEQVIRLCNLNDLMTQNSYQQKNINGVRVGFAWSNSATELSMHPAGIVFIDEIDKMADEVEKQGTVVELCDARTTTFSDGFLVITSTPTFSNSSKVLKWYNQGTKNRWCWYCDRCKKYFAPTFRLLKWSKGATPEKAYKTAFIKCANCGKKFYEVDKLRLNATGLYIPEIGLTKEVKNIFVAKDGVVDFYKGSARYIGERPDKLVGSWMIFGGASPWKRFGRIASKFISAVKSRDINRIMAVVNLEAGEGFEVKGDSPDWETLKHLKQSYKFWEINKEIQRITAGVDVQKDRLIVTVRGWCFGLTSYGVWQGEILGNTDKRKVWENLEEIIINKTFQNSYGGVIIIRAIMIDAGYRPEFVYYLAQKYKNRVFATKGQKNQDSLIRASKTTVDVFGNKIKDFMLFHLKEAYFKGWIHTHLKFKVDEGGAWLLSKDHTDQYLKSITAEKIITKANGKSEWIKVRPHNHYLDAEKLNVAAAHHLHLGTRLKPVVTDKARVNKVAVRRVRSSGLA
jgi:phage terminase large subunit GpA-like protein